VKFLLQAKEEYLTEVLTKAPVAIIVGVPDASSWAGVPGDITIGSTLGNYKRK
jgi:hypothetical protein